MGIATNCRPSRRLKWRCAVHTLLLSVTFATAEVEWAGAQMTNLASVTQMPYGFVAQMPSDASYSRREGLRLEVDTRWPNNFGYRPIRVRVTSAKPTTIAHRISFRLKVGAWDWRTGTVAVEHDFDMPQGSTSAEVVVSCPQFHSGHRYWWETRIDGVLARDLSVAETAAWQLSVANSSTDANVALRFLIGGTADRGQRTIGVGSEVFETFNLPLVEFPERWVDYTAVDVIALSPGDLRALAESRPKALTAIGLWVRAGGQMWISPCGESWEQVPTVEQALQLQPAQPVGDSEELSAKLEPALAAHGWRPIVFPQPSSGGARVTFLHVSTGRTRVVEDSQLVEQLRRDPDYIVTEELKLQPVTAPTTAEEAGTLAAAPRDSATWFIQKAVGLGYVRAFRQKWDPVGFGISWRMLLGASPDEFLATPTPLVSAIETTRNWESRHGMTPDTANADFANLLVPGVGLAPVTEFRLLITAFVLAIGPLNYWLLARNNRLHLMVVTVPALAMVLTAGLFGYAFMSDGLSTTARVHSFATLDQRTGEAACWARLSYYAALAPGDGLTLPDDVAIYPIIPGWNESSSSEFANAVREIELLDGRQQLTAGWLRSRTPTQYLSVRARKTQHRLELEPTGDEMTVINRFGTKIAFLMVVDESGQVFSGEEISADASKRLKPTDAGLAMTALRRRFMENRPQMPPELVNDRTSFAESQRRRRRRMFRTQMGLEYGVEKLSDNVQSRAISELIESAGGPTLTVPPRAYVAITESGPEVEIGIQDAREEGSFHVVLGYW